MTNREALIAELGDISITDNLITKIMSDNEISETGTYGSNSIKAIDLCKRDIYLLIVTQPNIAEGNLSIIQNKGALLGMARMIEQKYGIHKPLNGKPIW